MNWPDMTVEKIKRMGELAPDLSTACAQLWPIFQEKIEESQDALLKTVSDDPDYQVVLRALKLAFEAGYIYGIGLGSARADLNEAVNAINALRRRVR